MDLEGVDFTRNEKLESVRFQLDWLAVVAEARAGKESLQIVPTSINIW